MFQFPRRIVGRKIQPTPIGKFDPVAWPLNEAVSGLAGFELDPGLESLFGSGSPSAIDPLGQGGKAHPNFLSELFLGQRALLKFLDPLLDLLRIKLPPFPGFAFGGLAHTTI